MFGFTSGGVFEVALDVASRIALAGKELLQLGPGASVAIPDGHVGLHGHHYTVKITVERDADSITHDNALISFTPIAPAAAPALPFPTVIPPQTPASPDLSGPPSMAQVQQVLTWMQANQQPVKGL